MTRKPTLIIHGASSFTATELLAYLDSHPQGDQFDFILAGRTLSKLEAKNAELDLEREIVAVDLTDEGSVSRLVEKGDVVVNLAGPFRHCNAEALIAECARTGKHYVDLCGESDWLGREIIPKYNYLASKTGACIIPSCGFDSVPSDMVLYNALSTLQARYPNESITRSLSMFKIRGTISGGTLASLNSVAELSPEERDNSEWFQTRPEAPPKLYYTLPSLPSLSTVTSRIGAFFFMYPYNRTLVRRSWFLSRLGEAQRYDADGPISGQGGQEGERVREPVHGDSLEYEESMDVGGNKVISALVTLGMGLFFGLFMASSLFRKIFNALMPDGHVSKEKLRNGHTSLLSISHTTLPDTYIETTYTGQGDPGYWHTCHLLAECALSLALPPPKGTSLPPLGRRGGCLTPSTALGGVLVKRLRDSGKVGLESRVVKVGEDRKRV